MLRIRIPAFHFYADLDSDPTFPFDADPDPDLPFTLIQIHPAPQQSDANLHPLAY
jgi:hypothetical protein